MVHHRKVLDDLEMIHDDESSTEEGVSDGNTPSDSTESSSRQVLHGDIKFPVKLHEMLTDVDQDDNATIVSWSPDGISFRVHKKKPFVEHILPRYFSQTKYRSFQRQLNHYGFDRILKGPFEGGYRHPDFVRDDPERCSSMRRLKRTSVTKKLPPSTTPPRNEGSWEENRDKIVAVSPEPSHRGSPNEGFDSRRENGSAFFTPMGPFRPVPQYHRARIVMGGGSLPPHPPGTQVYYHGGPPPPPTPQRVTHVYYVTSPTYHATHYPGSSYPAVISAPSSYHSCYAKATLPIVGALPPHAPVLHVPEYHEISHQPVPFSPCYIRPPGRKLMGMVPVDDDEEEEKSIRPKVRGETPKLRQKRPSFSSVGPNQDKTFDDLLLDFLSGEEDVEEDHRDDLMNTLTAGTMPPKTTPGDYSSYDVTMGSDLPPDMITINQNNRSDTRPSPVPTNGSYLCGDSQPYSWEASNAVAL